MSAGLFDHEAVRASAPLAHVPLAERMRPRHIDEVLGQQHLMGKGCSLRLALEQGLAHSCILWGPPGVGKTTIARLMGECFDAQFLMISAVLGGVKDIREAVQMAQHHQQTHPHQRTVVFVDEVHRFNKAQQDAFLPHVESGLLTFIGATTENPSFEVNSALLSRAQVYVLQALSEADLKGLYDKACSLVDLPILQQDALDRLVSYADGDARRMLNTLELLSQAKPQTNAPGELVWGSLPWLEQTLGEQLRRHDKGGDQFYDAISALHKSVRGSDPNAALYWLARMLDAGVSATYISRRLIRMASEDVGLADPRALGLALDAANAMERLGSPEGELALAQCVTYLAVAPKSNALYKAYNAARAFVEKDQTRAVPLHLRNAPTQLMKQLQHGQHYRYPHDEENAYAAGEHYFPDDVAAQHFYQPVMRGMEIKIAEKMDHLRSLDAQHHAGLNANKARSS